MSWTTALTAGADGLLRPLATPAHVIALIGLALIAGPKNHNGAAIIAAFAVGLAAGLGALAWGAGEMPAVDALLAGATLCGLVAASGVTAGVALVAPLALLAGVALGLDSPPDAIRLDEAAAMLIGTACGGVAALALMTPAASAIACWRQAIALRVAGSWIAAIAIMALAVRWGT
jgi:hypothetical protein